jgi:hypothetical protein
VRGYSKARRAAAIIVLHILRLLVQSCTKCFSPPSIPPDLGCGAEGINVGEVQAQGDREAERRERHELHDQQDPRLESGAADVNERDKCEDDGEEKGLYVYVPNKSKHAKVALLCKD